VPSRSRGIHPYCRPCEREYQRIRERGQKDRDPEAYQKRLKRSADRRRKKYQESDEYREKINRTNREKYHSDPVYRENCREAGRRWNEMNKDKIQEYHRQYRSDSANAKRRSATARRYTLSKYGLTEDSFSELLASQGGVCAICEGSDPVDANWNIDHCHDSGLVRGLLCGHCNRALGLLRDDPYIAIRAHEYLLDYQLSKA
jgi:hypothetical protein